MSHFKIYRVDHFDPKRVGGNKRRLFALYSILSPLTIAMLSTLMQTRASPLVVAAIVLPVTTVVYLLLYRKLKNEPGKLKIIGDIQFTRTLIKKRIGDSITEYNFESIKEIELEKHIPSVTPKDSKSGYFTYILRIVFYDADTESLVVSDKPVESRQNLSIVDTMKTLQKIIQPAVRISI